MITKNWIKPTNKQVMTIKKVVPPYDKIDTRCFDLLRLPDDALVENAKLAKLLVQANQTITGLRNELATATKALKLAVASNNTGDFEEDEDRHDTDY